MNSLFRLPLQATILILLLNACSFFTPAKNSSLYSKGYWLSFIDSNRKAYVVNSDGTGLTSLAPNLLATKIEVSPSSNHIALLTYLDNDILSYQVSLAKLPNSAVYRSISLLSYFNEKPETLNNTSTGPFSGILGDFQWSPDGKDLAFMGAIESPLSALYLYNADQDVTRKLSQNDFQAVHPTWSPDGKWIIYEEVSDFHSWQTEGIWAVSPQSGEMKLLYKPKRRIQQNILGWAGNDNLVVADRGMDGERNLRIVNITTGDVEDLYSGYHFGATLDPESGTLAFFPFPGAPGTGSNLESGIYLISQEIDEPQFIISSEIPVLIRWNSEKDVFESEIVCKSNPEEIIVFNSVGEVGCTQKQKPNSSPDDRWYIALDEQVNIYKSDGERTGEVPIVTKNVLWRLDSRGFFLLSERSLFYVSIPENEYFEVYNDNHYFDFKWVGMP